MEKLIIKKMNNMVGHYEPYRTEDLDLDMRDLLISFLKRREVKGYFQYIIPLEGGDKFVGYSVNPELQDYLVANKFCFNA